jgi:ADP-ribosylglycohydrolase
LGSNRKTRSKCDQAQRTSPFKVIIAEIARGPVPRPSSKLAARYRLDPARGYGGTAHGILRRIAEGEPWREVASSVFGAGGSMGNGGAMRAAPIGAYFFDDLARAARAARESAEVTHAHPEGQAGAVAVAVAAAWVASGGVDRGDLFNAVLEHTPDGETRAGIKKAAELPSEYDVRTAVSALGNGTQVISQDTVPFALWCTARHLVRLKRPCGPPYPGSVTATRPAPSSAASSLSTRTP